MPVQKQPAMPPQETLAHKLLHLMQELTKALEDEIELLDKHEYVRHPDILRRKQELTLRYQAALKTFNDSPDKSALINAQERATLQTQGKILEAVTQRNAKALRVAQLTSERLLDSVMNEVRKELHRESGYSRDAILIAAQKDASRPVAYSNRV